MIAKVPSEAWVALSGVVVAALSWLGLRRKSGDEATTKGTELAFHSLAATVATLQQQVTQSDARHMAAATRAEAAERRAMKCEADHAAALGRIERLEIDLAEVKKSASAQTLARYIAGRNVDDAIGGG